MVGNSVGIELLDFCYLSVGHWDTMAGEPGDVVPPEIPAIPVCLPTADDFLAIDFLDRRLSPSCQVEEHHIITNNFLS